MEVREGRKESGENEREAIKRTVGKEERKKEGKRKKIRLERKERKEGEG